MPPTPTPPPEPPLAQRRRRNVARIRERVLLLALAVHMGRGLAMPPERHLPPPAPLVVVDLTQDPAWRLALLPGIGRKRARAIVEARQAGLFESDSLGGPAMPADRLERLATIPGIGDGTLARLRLLRAAGLLCDGASSTPAGSGP